MTMTQLLEEDRQELLGKLETARTPDKMTAVLETEIDRILYRYNEECEREDLRLVAAWILQTVKAASGWVDAESRAEIWEQKLSGAGKKAGKPIWLYICLISGAALLLFSVFSAGIRALSSMVSSIILVLAGGALLAVAGWLWGRGGTGKNRASTRSSEGRQMVEILPDPAGVYRVLHTAVLLTDQNMQKAGSALRQAVGGEETVQSAGGVPGDLLKVIGSLLEAEYSSDGEYALERIADVRYYLHCHEIEVADRNEENANCFDEIPSAEKGTLRPALLYEGQVLMKGLYGA